MDPDTLIVIYIVTTAAVVLLSYFIIRFAVKHGTSSALREHEVWMRDGGLERAVDDRAAVLLEQSDESARTRARLEAERS